MNISALKSFAPALRKKLIAAIALKLDFVLAAKTPDYITTFASQVAALRKLAQADRDGLIERVAYTWFNRLAALRFIDARGWHPFRARVLMPEVGETQPQLLKMTQAGMLPEELQRHTVSARLIDLLDGRIPSNDAQGEVYRHLVLAACRFYNALLPDIFARLDDATELLLPDDLLTEQSVIRGFRTEISDGDCAEVEILGWLYQFYISERKDQVMARKSAVPTEDIPTVTQLFTPHWIVRYLVENSLGRLWLLNRPSSRLREHMPYYIEGEPETDFLKITTPENIRLCDPAVGSGHMLTYAFDLLTLIYEEEGYAPTEIPALILRHNLHGLEICPRAAQLAELALVFKAREKSRRFFQPEHLVRPRIIELRDVRFAENELRDYIHALGLGNLFDQPMLRLLHQFEEAKNFGSLIQPCLYERAIGFARRSIEAKDLGGQLFLRETHLKVLRVLEQAEALTQRYHVVVANPPYMGAKQMNGTLKSFARDFYADSDSDLFSMFIDRSFSLAIGNAYAGMITMQSWMFLSSYEELRKSIVSTKTFLSMAHLGARAFDTIGGAVVQSTAFVLANAANTTKRSPFFRLVEGNNEAEKSAQFIEAINKPNCGWFFRADANDFKKIPGSPIAYWITKAQFEVFQNPSLEETASVCIGMKTGDNPFFLRFWYEVSHSKCGFDFASLDAANQSGYTWFPYLKGGEYRKWHGNYDLVLRWKDNGSEILAHTNAKGISDARIRPSNFAYYFSKGINWSFVASGAFGVRIHDSGFFFDVAGSSLFPKAKSDLHLLAGILNSKVADLCLSAINPTLNMQIENIKAVPVCRLGSQKATVEICVSELKEISRRDWDNFETSWDFRDQPLLRPGLKGATLEVSWRNWEAQSIAAIRRMQELETENNRLFIAAYGLDGELQPEVPEAQITLARAEARRDMAAFLSYAVGCMMGRYSPDHPGLILANAGDSLREFLEKVGKPLAELTFAPDEDGIIPLLDGEWFEDDIVARTRDFLRATFGEATLRENLRFIEDSLGKDLRKYFLTDFYKDHLQTYKKRPIYWLVQSPRKGFSVLFYIHRYTRDTMNLVLNRYLRDYQVKLRNRLTHVTGLQVTATAKAKTEARKEADKLTKILAECEEWERQVILPLAQARIELDLDDGVKVNYLKLREALAPIPGLAAADE